ncbi:MAG: signal peptidase I [Xenococcaceae cyanobacterium]
MTKIVVGNASKENTKHWGWFLGHFINPDEDLRSTESLEVKWSVYRAGETRKEWAVNQKATTLSISIEGQFRLQFEDREIVLSRQGDYVIWCAGVPHSWFAQSDCTILTVRWPSLQGDSVTHSRDGVGQSHLSSSFS